MLPYHMDAMTGYVATEASATRTIMAQYFANVIQRSRAYTVEIGKKVT